MAEKDDYLLDLMVNLGLVTAEQVVKIRQDWAKSGKNLASLMQAKKLIHSTDLIKNQVIAESYEKATTVSLPGFLSQVESEIPIKPCATRGARNTTMPLGPNSTRTVVFVCLLIGGSCVTSTILKTWFGKPNALDLAILLAGLVLCGLSLFKQFKFGKDGLSASMKNSL